MANIFQGYIPSNGKIPKYSLKTGEILLEPPETGDYVGVLREDVIQLDFDDENTAKIIMDVVNMYKLKCDVLKTTRGVHLYFINNPIHVRSQSVGIFNAIGLSCDIGLGSKNRVIPLKITREVETAKIVNGNEVISISKRTIEREWLQTYEELEVLPAFLRPIGKTDYELKKCNTRNQSLFNYILTLQFNNFSKDEVRKTIRVINKFILYEPLSDRELDTITRDEAFSEELFFDDKRFLHDRFGNYMLTNSNILRIDNQIHIYTPDNLYSNDPNEFEKVMLTKIPSLRDAQRKEVYKYISLKANVKGEFANPKYIGMKDSILNIETFEEFPYSPKWVINNRIDVEYNPNAYSEVMDRTLDKVSCNDPQIRSLLEEMIGYTMYRKNSMQVCFILTGEGSNGKSTLLNCIKKLLGKQNYTSLDLRELEKTFEPAELYNKLANIGDDISAKYLENSSVFKKVVTGESFIVQRKYAQPFELESYATQIFCANELPQVHDKSDGFSRRIKIVPFNATFKITDPDYDPFIEDKLLAEESIQYLLKLGLEGLKRVIHNREFTKSDKSELEKSDYIRSNNNVLEWLEEDPHIENESVKDVYLSYQVWCTQNGCMPVKKLNFTKELRKQVNLVSKTKTIDGKSIRVYERG